MWAPVAFWDKLDYYLLGGNYYNGYHIDTNGVIDDDKRMVKATLEDDPLSWFMGPGILKGAKALSLVGKAGKQAFKSFSAFKRAMGPAGKNKAWHHIVEQHADNVAKFGQGSIHNTKNVISIPGGFKGSLHGKVTGHYNSLMPGTSMRVRDYIKTLPYDQQYQYGIDILKRFGWTP